MNDFSPVRCLPEKKRTALLSYLLFCVFLITGYFSNLVWLVLLLPVILLQIQDRRSGWTYTGEVRINAADAAFILICGVEIILTFFSKFRPNTIVETQRILLFCVFWFFSRTFIVYQIERKQIVNAISLFGGFIGLTTLVFFLVHKHGMNELGITDLTGYRQYYHPWGHISNDWVAELLCLMPFSLKAVTESESRKGSLLHLASFSLLVISLIVSFSRGAYLSVFVFLLFSTVFMLIFERKQTGKIIKTGGLVLVLSLPVIICEWKPISITLSVTGTTVQRRSIEGRYKKWDEAVEIFKLAPATGVGGGNYGSVSDNFVQDKKTNLTNRSTNTYLQILAEKGIIGASAYFMAIVLLAVAIIKRMKNDGYGAVFTASLISIGVREFFFSSFYPFQRVQFFFVLILFLIIQPVRENESIRFFSKN